jgi:uncharacterized Zn-finger protein
MSYIRLPPLYALPQVNMAILNLAPIKSPKQSIYKCTLCPKEFNHKSSLSRHFLNHTNENRFNCSVCKKKFNRKDLLNQHRKSMKCIVRSQNYNITGMHENEIQNSKFSKLSSSHVVSTSTIDERMNISWLLTESSVPISLLPDIDDYKTSNYKFYFIKFDISTKKINKNI